MKTEINCSMLRDFVAHFANPVRLKILCRLTSERACVKELIESTREKQSTVSQHLKNLLLAGFISRTREGNRVYYKIEKGVVLEMMGFLENLAAQIDAVDVPVKDEPKEES